MKSNQLFEKMATDPVFLFYTFEQLFIRSEPGGKFFAKRPGELEYEIKQSTVLVTEALLEGREVSKEEYEKGRIQT